MSKFKKYLSVLLAVMMLLTSVSALADGEAAAKATIQFPDVDANSIIGQSVAELVPYGIINGYEDGTFRPDNTITRAEFAKIIVTFLNLQNIGADGVATGFPDVDTATPHWAQKFISVAISKGIVNGYNDGTFKPDNPVKISEAVKMIVCALNYGDVAVSRTPAAGPWYAGYVAQAADLGILKNATVSNQEDSAARGLIAIFVSNALDADVATTTTTVGGASSTTAGGTTAREEFLNTQKVTGIVVSCEQTDLNVTNAIHKSRLISVAVDGKVLTYKVPSGTDTMGLLGYRITANINSDAIGDYAEISAITKDSINKVTTIQASNILSADASKVEYWESATSTKTRTLTYDGDAVYVYNGKVMAPGTVTNDDFMIDAGTLVLLSNDGNSAADVVFINDCEVFAVNSSGIDSESKLKKIYTLYNGGEIIVPEKTNLVSVDNKGTMVEDTTSFAVAKYDIINLYRSKDGEVFKMTITKDKKSGAVEEKSTVGITIKGKEYKYAHNFANYSGADKPAFTIGNNANIYLDAFGNIAAAENSATSAGSNIYVGYVVGAEKGEGINGVSKILVFGVAGKTGRQEYKLDSKVRVDGTLLQDAKDAIDVLSAAGSDVRSGKRDLEIATTEYSQLIKYTLKDGLVDSIDTILVNVDVASDDIVYSLPMPNLNDPDASRLGAEENPWDGKYKFNTGNTFTNSEGGTVMGINSSTKVIVVPEDVTDVSKYRTASSSYFTAGKKYNVEGYCLSETKIAQYVVVYPGADDVEITYQSDIALVRDVRQGTPEGDVDLINQDIMYGYNFKTGAEIKEESPLRAGKENLFFGKVQTGEVFRYATDNGLASKIEMVFEIEEVGGVKTPVLFREQLSEGNVTVNALDPVATFRAAKDSRDIQFDEDRAQLTASSCRIVYGTVVSKSQDDEGKNKTINLSYNIATDTCGVNPDNVVIFNLASSAKIFMIDLTKSDDEMITSELDFNEIRAMKNSGEPDNLAEASQVLMFYSGSTVRTMFIIKTAAVSGE